MAEASSLASKIDNTLLKCRVCFEPFQDPRALPCLHPFCCKCLVRWSKTCSEDRSIVSCPLCKKVYQIPKGGVEGFPAHFLVTNLRDTVDAEKKTTTTTQYCEIHAGEIKRYFCENCGYSICSDCSTIELIHKGHTFIRLNEAAKRQTYSLQSLFKKVKEVEQKYEIAIQQTEQVEQNLESSKNEVIHQLKDLIKRYEQDINKRKGERKQEIHIIKEKLQVELATMKSALEQGTEAVQRKQWKECRQIMTTPQARRPRGTVIHPNGDIPVTSEWAPVKVFSRNGDVKCVLTESPVFPSDISITLSNQYIICSKKEFHNYNSQGRCCSTIRTYDLNNKPSNPNSVAVDSRGRIIVGLGYPHKTVCIHQPDGTLISKFAIPSYSNRIACTPDDELVISCNDNTLQVMDQSGLNARIIQPPPGIRLWIPWYVCCSKQGELFVGNHGDPKAVYRYVSTGTGYKYADCITMGNMPYGIALSANEEELFVVDNWNDCIRIFKC